MGDPGSIPGSGRSSGEGHGNPLQYPCLGNPGKDILAIPLPPGFQDPGGLYHPRGSQRVRHDWETNTLSVKKLIPKKDAQLSWGHATSKEAEAGLGTVTQPLEIRGLSTLTEKEQ